MKLLTRIRLAFGPAKERRQVVCDESSFIVVEHGKTLVRVSWSEVREIFAFKENRFTTDDHCLGFRVHVGGAFWVVSEDFLGYKALVAELERRFSGNRPESDDIVGTDMNRDLCRSCLTMRRSERRRGSRGCNRGVPWTGSRSLVR